MQRVTQQKNKGVSELIQNEIVMFQDIIDRVLYLSETDTQEFIDSLKSIIKDYPCKSSKIVFDEEERFLETI